MLQHIICEIIKTTILKTFYLRGLLTRGLCEKTLIYISETKKKHLTCNTCQPSLSHYWNQVNHETRAPLTDPYHFSAQPPKCWKNWCRSTTTALLPLVHQVASGFNQNCPPLRTVAMDVDFSKAFDTVNHTQLLRSLLNNTVSANGIR